MARAKAFQTTRGSKRPRPTVSGRRLGDALSIAKQQGLLSGGRTLVVRGRMPSALVEQAKKKSGIQSDSKLIEAALARTLLHRRITRTREVDLRLRRSTKRLIEDRAEGH